MRKFTLNQDQTVDVYKLVNGDWQHLGHYQSMDLACVDHPIL